LKNAVLFRAGKPFLAFLALTLVIPPAAPAFEKAQDSSASESAIKAVFLFNFTRYLDWPEDNGLAYCPIAVLGDSGIFAPLQEIAEKKTVSSTPIQVRRYKEIKDVGLPRILYISDSAASRLPAVLEKFRGTDTLIVGETEGLAARGAAINFVLRDEAVKFEINVKALKDAGIEISSQLLKLAILIDGEKAAPGR